MEGAVTSLDIPGGGDRVVKEFYAFLEGDGLESLIIHGQCIDGVHVSYVVCCVCTWKGAVTLLDIPGGFEIKEF